MKTVRFSQVTAQCGAPEPYTLWNKPESDKRFQRALKEHRIMTIHQETVGSKKDYGEVGFTKDKQGNLLLFGKSLRAFEGRRIIGVKYELLKSAPAAASVPVLPTPAKKRPAKPFRHPFPKYEPVDVSHVNRIKPAEALPEKDATRDLARLTRLVRRAMKELKEGKSVAAYQTLENALGVKRQP
ncbi:MAG: hypothetical protein JWL90_3018 [Chthoniobacteraceae bacterium]|nr:hypothetical protein [Chthoniobacteraceae bacterium]